MTVRDNRSATHTEVINDDIDTTYKPPRQNYQSRQQTPQQQSNIQQQTTEHQHSSYQHKSIHEEPQCFRCGQYGHYKRGCAVNLDHSKKGLNFKKHMTRGWY
jgi:hypothetical protein